MKIAQFIREHIHQILEEWDAFAANISGTGAMPARVLRDHAEGILLAIADDLECAQTAEQADQKSRGHGPDAGGGGSQAGRHGADRVLEGFSVSDAMSEYRALRASVVRLWTQAQARAPSPAEAELTRFNEAVDQALTESLFGYSDDKERRGRLYDTLLSASPDLSFIVDTESRLVYGNAALAREFDMPLSTMRGMCFSAIRGHVHEQFEEHVRLVAASGSTALGELSNVRRGASVTYEYLLVPVTGGHGEVEAVAGIARDITERKANEERYKRSAQFDDLTGLPNRHLFRDRLAHAIRRADRIALPLALMFLDLDGFKKVNDLLGHQAGDDLLRQAGARIRACVRETDTVARLAGDEFTVILTEIRHMPHVNILAQQILDELARPFFIDGRQVRISASIGIALYPQDAGAYGDLLQHADQAMYAAKQSGRNCYQLFARDIHGRTWDHAQSIDELRRAVRERQLVVLYQPIVELGAGAVIGAEAQLCWQHPQRGRMPARDFAALADEAGLTGEIDALLLDDALGHAEEWRRLSSAPFYLSIENESLVLGSKALEQQGKLIGERISKAPSPVALEITEAMLLSDAPSNKNLLRQLANAGVPLCLDDFGAGYSSLSVLTMFPLESLRITPPVVQAIMDEGPRSLASGIIASGHALGLKIIARGVETQAQQDKLAELHCDYAQGGHFFGAMEGAAFSQLLQRSVH